VNGTGSARGASTDEETNELCPSSLIRRESAKTAFRATACNFVELAFGGGLGLCPPPRSILAMLKSGSVAFIEDDKIKLPGIIRGRALGPKKNRVKASAEHDSFRRPIRFRGAESWEVEGRRAGPRGDGTLKISGERAHTPRIRTPSPDG